MLVLNSTFGSGSSVWLVLSKGTDKLMDGSRLGFAASRQLEAHLQSGHGLLTPDDAIVLRAAARALCRTAAAYAEACEEAAEGGGGSSSAEEVGTAATPPSDFASSRPVVSGAASECAELHAIYEVLLPAYLPSLPSSHLPSLPSSHLPRC